MSGHSGKAIILSGHDYRAARRANMQPIADALIEFGYDVCFLSIGYSVISWIQKDNRCVLWTKANDPENVNGVQCYLWRTAFHPVNPGVPGLISLSSIAFSLYPLLPNRFIDRALRSATVVIVESGLGILLLPRVKAANDAANIVYLASDELKTLGVHPAVQSKLQACAHMIDHVCVPSRKMTDDFTWARDRLFFVPHGLNPTDFATEAPNPYSATRNAVCVGPSFFDAGFFVHAANQFPGMEFHVIGAGPTPDFPNNVRTYPEMAFSDTIAYIKHATIGIAPYRPAPGCEYLSDTSMKLMQYDHFGIPAVCPQFAVGDHPNRSGYVPGDPESIGHAVQAALQTKPAIEPVRHLTWREVTRRLLDPGGFADTRLQPAS